jgi:hypothetical protein
MSMRRRALAMGIVALSPLALAGCEKPAPGVTAWSGTHSEHVEAVCWQFEEGQPLTPRECAQEVLDKAGSGEGIARLAVTTDDTVGISVDPVVAESGWSIQIDGQTVAAGLTDTYYRFAWPRLQSVDPTGYTLQVIAAAKPTGNRGYWFFQLVPD